MAVNNFAPAEYGGYVLGANSGGGGGGSSPFDEQYGVDGWFAVEITFQLPESSTDSLEGANVASAVNINMEGGNILQISNDYELRVMLISDNKYTLHVPYISRDDLISTFYINSVNSSNAGYIPADDGYICSGGVEWDSDNYCFNVTGDGSVTLPLQYMD